MNKIRRFLGRLLLLISLVFCLSFSATNSVLAASTKQSDLLSNRFLRTTLLGFTAIPLHSQLSSNFSQCEEIQEMHPIEKIKDLGNLDFPVSTSNPKAQEFFNQGITLFYSFNDEDAIRSFRKATDLDPDLAMAHYGMALAAGSNINITADQKCLRFARESIQKAQELAKITPNNDVEKELINSLVIRYKPDDKKTQDKNYTEFMQKVYRNYPNDPNVAVLYTDSLMNLHPWQLWTPEGMPAQEETSTIVEILETALRTYPKHLGINHYYIHVMEASKVPDKALYSADILTSLAPAAGHINHMPSHIYARMGDYDRSAKENENSVQVDKPYIDNCKDISSNNCVQLYTGHYNAHDLMFAAVSYAMIGDFDKSYKWAKETTNFVKPFIKNQLGLIHYLSTEILMLERFRRWDDILNLPPSKEIAAPIQAIWHWSRAMAYLGKNSSLVEKERDEFNQALQSISNEESWGNNVAKTLLEIPSLLLDAKYSAFHGDLASAINLLSDAVTKQDNLVYDEPISWTPVREALGAAYYQNGLYSKAEEVFRQDIDNTNRTGNPGNARSLFGLYKTLEAQGNPQAQDIKKQFDHTWNPKTPIDMSDLF